MLTVYKSWCPNLLLVATGIPYCFYSCRACLFVLIHTMQSCHGSCRMHKAVQSFDVLILLQED